MALQHDPSTGFLRGESVADDVEQLAQELKLLRAIESNTRDIASRLGVVSQAQPAAPSEPPSVRRVMPGAGAANDPARERTVGSNTTPQPRQRSAEPAEPGRPRREAPAQPGARDSSGRFVRKEGQDAKTVAPEGSAPGAASAISSSIADAVRDIGGKLSADVDNVDPTIQAGKELSGILSPALSVFKPLGRLFGRNKDAQQTKDHRENVTWLRRIWRTQADTNKLGAKGGMGGMLGMLLALVSAVLAPFKALGRVLGLARMAGAAGGLMRGAGQLLGGKRSRAERASANASVGGKGKGAGIGTVVPGSKAAKVGDAAAPGAKAAKSAGSLARAGGTKRALTGVLKKIPIIGALLGGAMLASDAMAGDDPELSRDENKRNKYSSVGGGVGGILGGVLGLVGGPAGAIVGGILGDQLGSAVGSWLSTVDFDKVTTSITSSFAGLADSTLKAADGAFKYVKEGWGNLVTAGTTAITSMADWARETWKEVTEKVAGWKDTAADKVQTAKDYVGAKTDIAKDTGSNLLYRATGGRAGNQGSDARKAELVKAMDAGGITDAKSKAALMANMDHESGGFTRNEENLNYSAKRLREVFPKYYKTAEDARADAGKPEVIANKVYGGRMGNTDAGDGYKYRGRGDTQLTGKNQYAAMSKKLGVDLVNNPELAADPKYSAQIAVANWKSSGADKLATAGDMTGARREINGGTNGLGDVESKYDAYLAQAQSGALTPTRRADEGKVATPAAVNTALASTMATLGAGGKLATAPSVTPIGVMAGTRPRPSPMLASSIPATVAAPRLSTYAPAAADAGLTKIPTMTEVKMPQTAATKDAPPTVNVELPLGQNVADRGIAHAAAGGLGMTRY